ncbi:MAG: hypothetical protein ACPL1D_00460 [Microgenomates group bacterium]
MEFLSFLSYLNTFAFLLFIVISFFLGYQIYLLKKETRLEKKLAKMPDFKEENISQLTAKIDNQPIIKKEEIKVYKKNKIFAIMIASLFLILIGSFLVFDFLNKTKKENKNEIILTPKIEYLASSGIKIYNENWEEITDENIAGLKEGEKIYIGLVTIEKADIDKARIKVNRDIWLPTDITEKFLPDKKIFYKEYIIATGSTTLKIDGQLHSKIDGWLGE